MPIFNPADLTFNGREIESIAEALWVDVYEKPELNQIHTVLSGIKAKDQIAIAGLIGNVGKAAVGCPPTADGSIPFSEKLWDPEEIEIRLLDCWKELLPSFIAWGLANGVSKSDLTKTDYWNFVVERMADAIIEAVYRIAWFADTAEDDIAGGGNITNGVDPLYYTMIDGLWPQAIAITTATPSQYVNIAANAGVSYVLQALPDGAAVSIFEDLYYEAADFRLRDKSDLMFVCTQSIADNYAKYLREQVADASYERIENGYDTLRFENIPVVPLNIFDRKIRADFDTGTVWYLPHRVLLVSKANLNIGFDDQGSFDDIAVSYDAKDKETFNDALWSMDAKLPLDYLVAAAY